MGAHLARRYVWDASVEPDPLQMPSFPPDYGFPDRKERGELRAQARLQTPRNSVLPVCRGSVGSGGRLTSFNVEALRAWLEQRLGTGQPIARKRGCAGALRPGHSAEHRDVFFASPYRCRSYLATYKSTRSGWDGHAVHLSRLVGWCWGWNPGPFVYMHGSCSSYVGKSQA